MNEPEAYALTLVGLPLDEDGSYEWQWVPPFFSKENAVGLAELRSHIQRGFAELRRDLGI